jgi:uncharacterized protein (TIGR03663 family)
MEQRVLVWFGWVATIAVALWLRLDDLDTRPIHFDEATGARILSDRLEGDYNYNPKHFHGPVLSLAAAPIARTAGEDSWGDLTTGTLRIGVVAAGLLTVFTPLVWRRTIGPLGALGAGALLATSPLLVYYNRMYIHESWLVLFGMLALASVYRLIHQPSLRTSLLAGLFIGLMFATKETFAISVISWSVASLIILGVLKRSNERQVDLKTTTVWLAAGGAVAFAVGALLYSNFLSEPKVILDAISSYFSYETIPGHDKPAYYYVQLLVWPKHALGIWWTEGVILLLAAVSIATCLHWRHTNSATCFVLIGTILHFLIYSFIGYKTPWLILLPWAQVCLLAAFSLSRFFEFGMKARLLLLGLFAVGVFFQLEQSRYASLRFANDERNPYAYVPTKKDPARIQSWLSELNTLKQVDSLEPIAVVGREYWPLPWYLREFKEIGYWPATEQDYTSYPLVFSMPSAHVEISQHLAATHRAFIRTLRNNVSITLFLRNDIYEAWQSE